MPQQIRRFAVGQTAKVIGVLYALVGIVFLPVFLVGSAFAPKASGFGTGLALALPILYGVGGFVFSAIGCVIYNFVAGLVGGIEVELDAPR